MTEIIFTNSLQTLNKCLNAVDIRLWKKTTMQDLVTKKVQDEGLAVDIQPQEEEEFKEELLFSQKIYIEA